jgi:hypothetical protein
VKLELEKLDLSFLWVNATEISITKGNAVIKQRLKDAAFREMKLAVRNYSSCKELVERDVPAGMVQELKELGRADRRLFAIILLDCPGSLILRTNDGRVCSDCGDLLDQSIFVHKISVCEANESSRKKIERKEGLDLDSYQDCRMILCALESGIRLGKLFG